MGGGHLCRLHVGSIVLNPPVEPEIPSPSCLVGGSHDHRFIPSFVINAPLSQNTPILVLPKKTFHLHPYCPAITGCAPLLQPQPKPISLSVSVLGFCAAHISEFPAVLMVRSATPWDPRTPDEESGSSEATSMNEQKETKKKGVKKVAHKAAKKATKKWKRRPSNCISSGSAAEDVIEISSPSDVDIIQPRLKKRSTATGTARKTATSGKSGDFEDANAGPLTISHVQSPSLGGSSELILAQVVSLRQNVHNMDEALESLEQQLRGMKDESPPVARPSAEPEFEEGSSRGVGTYMKKETDEIESCHDSDEDYMDEPEPGHKGKYFAWEEPDEPHDESVEV